MKQKLTFLLFFITVFSTSCSEKSFSELNEEEKKVIIENNIKSYIESNKSKLELKNYYFLLKYSNMLKPCPVQEFKTIRVYFKDEITAESSIISLQSYEYLNPDKINGEIDMYGLRFLINKTSGKIDNVVSYLGFTKWSDGEIGVRESLGSNFIEYDSTNLPDIELIYGNDNLIQQTKDFYEKEMQQKQIENKHKCP